MNSVLAISNKLRLNVLQTIDAFQMFRQSDAILIGVSGGPDSVALLHILVNLAGARAWRIGVAHLDHGLRPGFCEDEARFVELMCRHLNLPCYSEKADVQKYRRDHGLSLEEAARICRYGFFEHTASRYGFNRVALGHHADDNAELALMYLFRGSGMTGMSGIPPVRNRIVRPLIRVRRTELIQFLENNHLPFVTDFSNDDVRFTRNHVRQTILPLLESAINPNIVDTLNRLTNIMRQENEWIDIITDDLLASCTTGQGPDRIHLSTLKIQSLHQAAVRRILRQAILTVKGDLRKITFHHVEAIIGMVWSSSRHGMIHLPDRIMVIRSSDDLCIQKQAVPLRTRFLKQTHPISSYRYQIQAPVANLPATLDIVEIGARLTFVETAPDHVTETDLLSASCALLDMESLMFPLTIREILPGDRFKPLGTAGFQKIKKFFIDHKVDPRQRKISPVVLSDNRIVCVCGHRIDADFRLRSSTKRIFKMTFQIMGDDRLTDKCRQ